jgi:hypothetical protein
MHLVVEQMQAEVMRADQGVWHPSMVRQEALGGLGVDQRPAVRVGSVVGLQVVDQGALL